MALEDAGATKEKSKKKLQQNKHGISKFHTMNLYSNILVVCINQHHYPFRSLSVTRHSFLLCSHGSWMGCGGREREVVM